MEEKKAMEIEEGLKKMETKRQTNIRNFYTSKGEIDVEKLALYCVKEYHVCFNETNFEDIYSWNGKQYTNNTEYIKARLLEDFPMADNFLSEAVLTRIRKFPLQLKSQKMPKIQDLIQEDMKFSITANNGIVKIVNVDGKLAPVFVPGISPDYFVLNSIPCDYNPGVQCPAVEKAIKGWFVDKGSQACADVIQKYCGYILFDRTHQAKKALFLTGRTQNGEEESSNANNGKSAFASWLREMLGGVEFVSSFHLSAMNPASFDYYGWVGKELIVDDDAQTTMTPVALSEFKCHNSPNSLREIKVKFEKKTVQTVVRAKMLVLSNHSIINKVKGDEWFTRMINVPMLNVFDPSVNINFEQETTTKEAREWFLNWAIEGFIKLVQDKYKFPECDTDEVLAYEKATYLADSNETVAYIKDSEYNTLEPFEEGVREIIMYDKFNEWCRSRSIYRIPITDFEKSILDIYYKGKIKLELDGTIRVFKTIKQ